MIKVKPTEETQIVSKLPYPPDPFDRWNEPVAIIGNRKPTLPDMTTFDICTD